MPIWLDRVVILRGMKKQIKSFKSAFRGFCFAVKSESHMRFHLVATFYVFVFGCFYDFSAAKWALLAVLCALIIALEMVNTCVEKLCDLFCHRYDFSVKIIKDIAAAAVLAVSFPAVFTAVLFFLGHSWPCSPGGSCAQAWLPHGCVRCIPMRPAGHMAPLMIRYHTSIYV